MDPQTRSPSVDVPVGLRAGAARRVGAAAPGPSYGPSYGGDLASDAAAIHRNLRTLLTAARSGDPDAFSGLLEVEAALQHLRRRVEQAGPVFAARSTQHLVRDARRSIHEARQLVERELAHRTAAPGVGLA